MLGRDFRSFHFQIVLCIVVLCVNIITVSCDLIFFSSVAQSIVVLNIMSYLRIVTMCDLESTFVADQSDLKDEQMLLFCQKMRPFLSL